MKQLLWFYLVTILIITGCSSKIKNGTYLLDYAYKGTESNTIGEQDQELQIENDKITLVVYEPYIAPLKGTINKDKIIFVNGDTLLYKKTKDGLHTYHDGLVYVWYYKK